MCDVRHPDFEQLDDDSSSGVDCEILDHYEGDGEYRLFFPKKNVLAWAVPLRS